MDTLTVEQPRRYLKKTKLIYHGARSNEQRLANRRKGTGVIMGAVLILLALLTLLFLATPLITRDQVLIRDLGGGITVTDQPSRFSRIIE